MTRDEAKKYFKELAEKQGLSEDEMSPILKALDSEKVGKVIFDGFVPRPQYSSDLDAREAEKKAALARKEELEKWYKEEGRPAYEQNLRGVKTLEQYIDRYGPLTEDEKKDAIKETGLSLKQVEELLDKKMKEKDQLYINLTKDAIRLSQDHFQRFKEPLDIDGLEKLALEKGLPLQVAYRELIDPKVKAVDTAAWEAKVKAAREEGARDALSRHKLPTDSGPRTPHPIFDQEKVKEGIDPDKAAKEAFMEGWNNFAEEVEKK